MYIYCRVSVDTYAYRFEEPAAKEHNSSDLVLVKVIITRPRLIIGRSLGGYSSFG